MDFNDDNVSNLIRDGNWNRIEEMLTNRLNAPISTSIQTLMKYESNFNHRKGQNRQKSLSDFNILLKIMNAAHGRNRESIFLRVLKIWMDHHPKISVEQDKYGFTLLHHICLKKSHNVDLMEYLITQNSDSLKIVDKVGRTPIYILCCTFKAQTCDDTFIRLLQRFVHCCPSALVSKCITGKTPLLAYLEREEDMDHRVVQILSTNDEILWRTSPSGLLPIEYYWAASEESKTTNPLVIQALLQDSRRKGCGLVHTVIGMNGNQSNLLSYVLQWFKNDTMIYFDGQLPLHYVLTNPWLSFYWRLLLKAFPGAAKELDRTTNLYPFLTATLTCTYLDICYELLRVEPNLVSCL